MENKLGITEGEWFIQGDKYPTIQSRHNGDGIKTLPTIATVNSTFIEYEEYRANSKLMTDAGNTAQKCGLLPSKLLAQRDEMMNAINLMLETLERENLLWRYEDEVTSMKNSITKVTE